MCRLIETMAMIDGEIQNLEYHQWRVNWSFEKLFPQLEPLAIDALFSLSERAQSGLVKARIVYGEDLYDKSITAHESKVVTSLKLVESNLDYSCKYEARDAINELSAQRGDADTVLIVKHGYITDTAYSNVALFDGMRWVTPDTPLLRGTMRESLLRDGTITERSIPLDKLQGYEKVRMINALIPFEAAMDIAIEDIT